MPPLKRTRTMPSRYSADDTTLYRYPVIGTPGVINNNDGTCPSGCRTYYDVYMPQDSVHFNNVPGKKTTLWQPSWENLNALSYPAIVADGSNPVPTPDLGSYSFVDANGQTQSVNKPLYNQVNTIGGNSGTVDLDFSSAAGSGNTHTHARTWTAGLDTKFSAKVSVGDPDTDGASLKVTASLGFDITKATNHTTSGTSQTSSSQSFSLVAPQGIDPGKGYDVGTAFYYGEDGSAKVVHGVDLSSDPQGKGLVAQRLRQDPRPGAQPARPDRADSMTPATTSTTCPLWLTSPQRQLIRGFQVLQAGDDETGLPTGRRPVHGQPHRRAVGHLPGARTQLQPGCHGNGHDGHLVRRPSRRQDIGVTGPDRAFGTSTVPALAAQGSANVSSPTWTAPTANANQPQSTASSCGSTRPAPRRTCTRSPVTACPVDSLEPTSLNNTTPALYDTMSQSDTARRPSRLRTEQPGATGWSRVAAGGQCDRRRPGTRHTRQPRTREAGRRWPGGWRRRPPRPDRGRRRADHPGSTSL